MYVSDSNEYNAAARILLVKSVKTTRSTMAVANRVGANVLRAGRFVGHRKKITIIDS